MENNREEQPLVSVIMPCYNHRKYVKEAIESVLAQSYTNFEFLIADDGSTDGTAEVVKEFTDKRITFYEYKENTAFAACEQMNCIAKGKYITSIASDDKWREDKLEKQVAFLEEHLEYKACFTWVETIDDDSNVIVGNGSKDVVFNVSPENSEVLYKKFFMQGNCLAGPSYMMNNQVFQELDGFRFKYRQLQDYDLWMRYLLHHKIYVIPEKLVFYRWHEKDGIANISAGSKDTYIRTWNEKMHILSEQIELIEDEFFVKVFEKNLLKKAPLTHEEVMCEKFFLLLNHPVKEAQQCGIDFYLNHIDDYEFAVCMEEVYEFTRADFWVMEVNRGVMKSMYDFLESAEENAKVAQRAVECLNRLQK